MNKVQIPDDIQILLDCLSTRDDLELDEMTPLQDWIDNTQGGELALSKALAQNAQLESALADMKISVPKTLERKVSSYVLQNVDIADEDSPNLNSRPAKHIKPSGPFWRSVKFVAGMTACISAFVIFGASIVYVLSFYSHFDKEEVALNSVEWIQEIDDGRLWAPPLPGSYDIPGYVDSKVAVTGVAEFKSPFGTTAAYDLLHSTRNVRGVLFVFQSSKKYDHKFIGKTPDFSNATHQVGIAKDGRTSYVLTVESSTPSEYASFISHDLRATQLAFLLRTVWLLC